MYIYLNVFVILYKYNAIRHTVRPTREPMENRGLEYREYRNKWVEYYEPLLPVHLNRNDGITKAHVPNT